MSKGAGASWSDQRILDATKQVQEGNYVQLKITLPDKTEFKSENMDRAHMKAGTLIAWCEAVRNQIDLRHDQLMEEMARKKAERKRREAMVPQDGESVATVDVKSSTPAQPSVTSEPVTEAVSEPPAVHAGDDPLQFATRNLEVTKERLTRLQQDAQKILNTINELKIQRSQWQTIVDNLTGDE